MSELVLAVKITGDPSGLSASLSVSKADLDAFRKAAGLADATLDQAGAAASAAALSIDKVGNEAAEASQQMTKAASSTSATGQALGATAAAAQRASAGLGATSATARTAAAAISELRDQQEREIALLGRSAQERAVETQAMRQAQELQNRGLIVTKAEMQSLRELAAARVAADQQAAGRTRTAALQDELTLLRQEAPLLQAGTVTRAERLAVLQRELLLKRQGVDLTTAETREELRLVAATARQRAELEQQRSAIAAAATEMRRHADEAGRAQRQVTSLRDVTRQVGFALGALGVTVGLAATVRETLQATTALQGMRARLSDLTGSTARAAQEEEWLIMTSRDLSGDLVTLGDSWTRLLPMVNSGILTWEQARKILAGYANVAAATGAGNTQLGQSLFGLSQGLTTGKLRAEEYNQTVEPLIGLAGALDRAFVKVTGSTGNVAGAMRQAVVDGNVTSELFGRVLVAALQEYDGAAQRMAGNLQQTVNRLNNEWTLFLEAFARPATEGGTSLLDSLAAVLAALRENIEAVRTAALAAGTAIAFAFGARLIAVLVEAGRAMAYLAGLFLGFSPLGLVVGFAALALSLTSVSAGATVATEALDSYRKAMDLAQKAADAAEGGSSDLAEQLGIEADAARAAARAQLELARARLQERISRIEDGRKLSEGLGGSRYEDPFAPDSMLNSRKQLNEVDRALLALNDSQRNSRESGGVLKPAGAGGGGGGGGGTKEQADALEQLLNRLDPVRAAVQGLAQDQLLLEQAFRAGQISSGDYAILVAKLKDSYRDALDPLGAYVRQQQDEIGLLGLSASEREIQQQLLQAEQALRQKGIEVGATELQQLRDLIVARRQGEAASASRERAAGLTDDLALVQAEIALVGRGTDERSLRLAILERELQLKREGLDLSSDEAQAELGLVAATERARQKLAQQQGLFDELSDFGTRAFDRIGSAITEAFANGSLSALDFGALAKSVISELIQELLKLAAINPLKNALFGGSDPTIAGVGGLIGAFFNTGSAATTTNIVSPSLPTFYTTAGVKHSGGVIGPGGPTRQVDMAVFERARRYHGGGIIGPGERAIIAKDGEEMLTAADARHSKNGGGITIENHVHEAPGTKARTTTRRDGNNIRIDTIVEQVEDRLAGRVSEGTGSLAPALERSYGVSRNNGELR